MNSLGAVLPLGSTLAYGLSLFFLGLWWAWLGGASRFYLCGAALTFAVVALTHQMTASWAALIAVGFLTPRIRDMARSQWFEAAAAFAAVTAVVLMWPPYSVLSTLANLDGFDELNAATYRRVAIRSALALPGVAIVISRSRRGRDAHISIALVLLAAVWILGWATGKGSLGRVFPGVMLLAHASMADYAAGALQARNHTPIKARRAAFSLVVVLSLGLIGTAPGWLRSVPRSLVPASVATRLQLTSTVDPNREFSRVLRDTDVVVSAPGVALPIAAYAAKVVSVPAPQPLIQDAQQRRADAAAILDPTTSSMRRAELLASYSVDVLVVEALAVSALLPQLPGAMVEADINGFLVIRLDS